MTRPRRAIWLTTSLTVMVGAAFVAVAEAAKSSSKEPSAARTTPPRPHTLQVFINGKRRRTTRLTGGVDTYLPVRVGGMRVVARWQTNARGTGYHVKISTSEPRVRTYATCFSGTSCRVATAVRIKASEEMSWLVRVIKTREKRVVAGVRVCLVGTTSS
jgi:hypothetical protein